MKILAMAAMLLDHCGAAFFPEAYWLRWIGRLAFPLYAYSLVLGYTHTRSLRRYFFRLAVLGAVAQLPFMVALDASAVNTIGSLLVCLGVLWALDRLPPLAGAGVACAAFALLEAAPFDYGGYALVLVMLYRYASPATMLYGHFTLNLIYLFYKGWLIQSFSFLASLIALRLPDAFVQADKRVPRWLWLTFYPVHLTVIAVTKLIWV